MVALDDVSFDIRRGDIHALLGENGAGKSTLIKILTGVHKEDAGEVYLNGERVHIHDMHDARRFGIGTVFQENSLLPHLSVAANVYLTREIRDRFGLIDWRRTYAECRRWCAELGVDIDPRARISDLSVAQQQIVEIVKVFSQNPSFIILDEPTSALSDNEIDHLFEIVKNMQGKGITFLYVSHRMEEIQQLCDRGTVLRDGKFVADVDDLATAKMDDIIKLIVGRDLTEKYPSRNAQIGDIVLEVENLSVPRLLYNVSFSVRRGEVLGLAGLVGSGRTTTAKAIFGAIPGKTGSIRIDNAEVRIRHPMDAIRHDIGLLPEDRKAEGLFLTKPLSWNVTFAALRKYIHFGLLNEKKVKDEVNGHVDRLSIKTPSLHQQARLLSGGNQQKVVFAKWLTADSKIYIFDEPTRGIDVGAKSEIYRIINRLAENGATIIVISSELPEILGTCDRILVFHEGRITGELTREQATQEAIMHHAIGGLRQ
ncbi:MAG: sugar ABC transporter ATP-binding protein [Planctomycetaceae bacterium]|nr:sugar ABC transporter ATP-binding protein [Planctomycetaceae bacterium]